MYSAWQCLYIEYRGAKNNLQQMKERGEKMPKLKINESELRCRTLRGCIKNAQEIQGINTIKTAELTGIPVSTLYARLKNPDDFSLRELRDVFRVLKIPEKEKERIAREVI